MKSLSIRDRGHRGVGVVRRAAYIAIAATLLVGSTPVCAQESDASTQAGIADLGVPDAAGVTLKSAGVGTLFLTVEQRPGCLGSMPAGERLHPVALRTIARETPFREPVARVNRGAFATAQGPAAGQQPAPSKRSWRQRHPVLFGTLVGYSGGFLIGLGDYSSSGIYTGLLYTGPMGAGAGAALGAVLGR